MTLPNLPERLAEESSHQPGSATIRQRLREYNRIVRLTSVIGAALLGEVALFNALHSTTPHAEFFGALFTIAFILTGAFAALARGACDWQIEIIGYFKDSNKICDAMTMEEASRKTKDQNRGEVIPQDLAGAKALYIASIILTILSGLVLVAWVLCPLYWSAVSSFFSSC